MFRAVLTPTLLLAVLIQAAFGVCCRHSHGPANRPNGTPAVSAGHGHHHTHGHHHGRGHDHGPPPAGHFHFSGEGDEGHHHERCGDDTYSYVAARGVALPTADVAWVGRTSLDAPGVVGASAEPASGRERVDAFGRSGRAAGRHLSLLGVRQV